MTKKSKVLFTGYEWDIDTVEAIWEVVDKIGKEQFKLDYYQPQFDIVTAEQMLDAYSSVGLPIFYGHWSFGKTFIQNQKDYKNGKMGLAYEMVINSNPCLAYLMEDNSATTTALVIAHANVGHSHFFKNNYLFKQHTNPDSILDFLQYAKKFIMRCEEQYGMGDVEYLLDMLHEIAKFGVDKYPRKDPVSYEERLNREELQRETALKLYNHEFDNLPMKRKSRIVELVENFMRSMIDSEDAVGAVPMQEENLLRFIIDHSLILKSWQKEIVRIIMKIEQYFYPQGQTKIMNEGFACLVHYHIMQELYNQGYINEGSYLEFLQLHTAVCYQPDMTYINPYALGFEIFMDIKRACLNPDEEDYKWLGTVAGKENWMEEIKHIVKYYKDESFILQFLSPKVIRKFKLFSYIDVSDSDVYEITGVQSDNDIKKIKETFCKQVELDNRKPDLEITGYNKIDNEVNIKYKPYRGREFENIQPLADIIRELTGFDLNFEEEDQS